jgi:hypothetical protein
MIRTRVANIIKRFARHRDYMRLAKFERVRGFDAEWKLLRRPSKHRPPNLTPLWTKRNFGADGSNVVAVGILKRDVNVTVCFHSWRQRRALSARTTFAQTAFSPLCSASNPHPALALPMRKFART